LEWKDHGQSSKHQTPSSRETSSSKFQTQRAALIASGWNLLFGASLELGAWSLELFILQDSSIWLQTVPLAAIAEKG
jgi:hypothetical protein